MKIFVFWHVATLLMAFVAILMSSNAEDITEDCPDSVVGNSTCSDYCDGDDLFTANIGLDTYAGFTCECADASKDCRYDYDVPECKDVGVQDCDPASQCNDFCNTFDIPGFPGTGFCSRDETANDKDDYFTTCQCGNDQYGNHGRYVCGDDGWDKSSDDIDNSSAAACSSSVVVPLYFLLGLLRLLS